MTVRSAGPVGDLVTRLDLERRITEQQDEIRANLSRLGSQSVRVLGAIGSALAGLVTVLVLSFLMLLEAPRVLDAAADALPAARRERIVRLARGGNRAVTGYMAGNLLISVLAGVTTYVFLWVAGVPFRGVLALWVALADLVPLVGATVGAVVVILVALLQSPAAGIAAAVFFVAYQQIENHVVQPVVQARTVKLSPLTVLLSVLAGVELAGILGALLAIPVAGVASVVARDLWEHRRGRGPDAAGGPAEPAPGGISGGPPRARARPAGRDPGRGRRWTPRPPPGQPAGRGRALGRRRHRHRHRHRPVMGPDRPIARRSPPGAAPR